MDIGKKLKELRKENNYTQQNVADFLRVSRVVYNRYENNQREIEFLEFQLKELDDAAVKQNEEEELNEELNVLSNVQELKEGSYSASWALSGDNDSIVEALGKIKYTISSWLDNIPFNLNLDCVEISLEITVSIPSCSKVASI